MTKNGAQMRELEAVYQQELMEAREAGAAACPSSLELSSLLLEDVAAAERERLADHIVTCKSCAGAFRLLSSLDREAAASPRQGASRSWRFFIAAGVAAALLASAGSVWWYRARTRADVPVLRGAIQTVRPGDGADLTSFPLEFSWPREPGASGYRVRLHRPDGALVWESALVEEAHAAIGPEARAALGSGRSFYWIVAVEGRVVRERLGPFSFTIR